MRGNVVKRIKNIPLVVYIPQVSMITHHTYHTQNLTSQIIEENLGLGLNAARHLKNYKDKIVVQIYLRQLFYPYNFRD